MKFLVVLSAVAACAVASPSLLAASWAAGPIAPGLLAAPGLRYLSAPAITSYSSLAYSAAPALAYSAAPALAAAPLAYSAPLAAPAIAAAPLAAPAVVAAPATKSQYHAQDELGNTAFGHSEPGQTHTSVQDAAGNRVGSFSYLNPTDGQIHRTDYVADSLGYRVAANDLPLAASAPVAEPAEVVAARAAHLAAHSRARRSVALLHTPASTAPLAAPVVAARAVVAAPALAAPLAYSAPIAAPALAAAPLAYSAPLAAPALAAAPLAYSAAPAGIPATLTTIVNNPGHAVSYRID